MYPIRVLQHLKLIDLQLIRKKGVTANPEETPDLNYLYIKDVS
jgi:hypothetical protein